MYTARFHYGKVQEIDMAARELVTQYERIPFDKLVIAAGTTIPGSAAWSARA